MSSDKVDFANFFDLVVRLASSKEDREDFSVSRDLAPLLQRLETVLAHQDAAKPISRNLPSHADGDVPTFPFAEEYPFTFKLMIHKLYDMDEWAKKVKEVVEESQCQYKPLPEELKNYPKSPRKDSKTREEEVDSIRAMKKRRMGRTRAVSGPSFVPKPSWICNANQTVIRNARDEDRPKNKSGSEVAINPSPRPRYQSFSRLDTNARGLKRAVPIEEPPQPTALNAGKMTQFPVSFRLTSFTSAPTFESNVASKPYFDSRIF